MGLPEVRNALRPIERLLERKISGIKNLVDYSIASRQESPFRILHIVNNSIKKKQLTD